MKKKIIISRDEKALIKAYVRFQYVRTGGFDMACEAKWLESDLTVHIIRKTDAEYRDAVEDFITEMLRKEYQIY